MTTLAATSRSNLIPTIESLLDEARQMTGLSDFGPGTFREGLGVYLENLRTEPRFPEQFIEQLLHIVRRRLTNRLQIEEIFRANPGLATFPIAGMTSITGLPRTGTSALVQIMSLDPQFRSPRAWEQAEPCPPPVAGQEENDPRRIAEVSRVEQYVRDNPGHAAMHIYDGDAPEEDFELLGLDFKTQQFAVPVPGYHAWWRGADLRPTFQYHRRVLQLLQSRRPPNYWLIKNPAYIYHLDALAATYPDARIVMTHRDPAKAIPSAVDLVTALFPPAFRDDAFRTKYARHCVEHLRIGLEAGIAARERIGEHRFLDINHGDFNRDPFGTLKRIYAFLGRELRPQVHEIMEQWHVKNRSGAHGEHRYAAEMFGYTQEEIRAEFEFYIKRFDVPLS